jgi:glycosyltransferase involved in cell wall biosynthesis
LAPRGDDPPTLGIEGLQAGGEIAKYSLLKRRLQEFRYAHRVCRRIEAFAPDAVLSGNALLETQAIIQRCCRRRGARFVFWAQDLVGVGVRAVLKKRLPVLGAAAGWAYSRLERRLTRRCDAVVAISEDFAALLGEGGVAPERIHVVHNWAPLEDLPALPRDNPWAARQGLAGRLVLLYSGTLGLKHVPGLLEELAADLADDPRLAVVVVSQGRGADYLRRRQAQRGLANLRVLDFQPYEDLPAVLASADVLVGVLNPDAGVFSVPSKTLSYLCAARPILLAVPRANLAARIVADSGAGLVVEPDDQAGFIAQARLLAGDAALRARMGAAGRVYAQKHFDIEAIAGRFERILGAGTAAGPYCHAL